ncbi:MAG: SUMF1/EgtB/PvdO family nonheme iron enzyme [Planctomycetota bacterium]
MPLSARRSPCRSLVALATPLALVALLVGLAANATFAQKSTRSDVRGQIEKIEKKLEKLAKEIEKDQAKLDDDKADEAKRHARAYEVDERKAAGAELAKALAGQCGPNKPDRKSPEAIVKEVEVDLRKRFGSTIFRASEALLVERVAEIMEVDEDPSETRCARVIGEAFEASFDKEFEAAWKKLRAFSSEAGPLDEKLAEQKALIREREDLLALLTSNIKGNHPRAMVPVPGGKVPLGIQVDEIAKLAQMADSTDEKSRYLVWNSSRDERQVGDFLMDKYEVTQLAYWYYCQETGHTPPSYTVKDPTNPEKDVVVPIWPDNKIPEGWERRPVFFVTCEEAVEYCEWTGTRLPTELEWELAARSDRTGFDGRFWPFGTQWKKYCANDNQNHDGTLRKKLVPPRGLNYPAVLEVGAMEDGRSPLGIFDLAGNIAEWTSSPFVANPSFKKGKYFDHDFTGSEFSDDLRTLRGGHCDQGPMMANSVFRSGLEPWKKAKFVGFRRARSALPGRDRLTRLTRHGALDAALQNFKLLKDDKKREAHWPALDESAGRFAALEKFDWNEDLGVPGAAHAILAVNRLMDEATRIEDYSKLSQGEEGVSEALLIGVFHTDVPIEEPALAPGTWFVAFKEGYRSYTLDDKGRKLKGPKIEDSLYFVNRRPDVETVRFPYAETNLVLNRTNLGETKITRSELKSGDFDLLSVLFVHEAGGSRGRKGIETEIKMKVRKDLIQGYE